jgi:hypothetical protein
VVGRNAGIFLRHARSGRSGSARASAGDRVVAAQVELAWLTVYGHLKAGPTLGKLRPVRVWTVRSRRLKLKMRTLMERGSRSPQRTLEAR